MFDSLLYAIFYTANVCIAGDSGTQRSFWLLYIVFPVLQAYFLQQLTNLANLCQHNGKYMRHIRKLRAIEIGEYICET